MAKVNNALYSIRFMYPIPIQYLDMEALAGTRSAESHQTFRRWVLQYSKSKTSCLKSEFLVLINGEICGFDLKLGFVAI